MLLQAVREYWVLYVMAGVTVLGGVSLIWLSAIIRGLMKDLTNVDMPKKKLLKQLRKRYESCCQKNGQIRNMDAFVIKNLYGHRFFGFTMNSIRKIWGQALFVCLFLAGASAWYAYYMDLPEAIMTNYIMAGIGMAALLLLILYGFDIPARQAVLEAGVYDYLENYLEAKCNKEQLQEDSEIEYLKDTIKQIAAEIEKKRSNPTYTLKEEDGKLIEEVLCEFFG